MQPTIPSNKVEDLIWHALTANGVEDRDFLIDWSWASCPVLMENCMGLLVTKRKHPTIPVFKIYFSTDCFRFATKEQRETNIVHEACHVAECLRIGDFEHYSRPHGPGWVEAMRRTGYLPTETTKLKVTDEELKQIKNLT